jgi:hypothetical protein
LDEKIAAQILFVRNLSRGNCRDHSNFGVRWRQSVTAKITVERETLIMLRNLSLFMTTLFLSMHLIACSKSTEFVTWMEEVKLNDDRTIVVEQKKRCQGAYTGGNYASCIAREAWLTLNQPEFRSEPIVWHESLDPMIVNVDGGRLYIVGTPPTEREYRLYGNPEPPYIGFVWDNSQWKKIPFKDIPIAIYDTNMLIESVPPIGTSMLTLEKKDSVTVNGRPEYHAAESLRRINPAYKSGYPPIYQSGTAR